MKLNEFKFNVLIILFFTIIIAISVIFLNFSPFSKNYTNISNTSKNNSKSTDIFYNKHSSHLDDSNKNSINYLLFNNNIAELMKYNVILTSNN